MEIILSEKGKDFKGRTLDEDTLKNGQPVVYKKKIYITGNRRHYRVDLYDTFGLFEVQTNSTNVYLMKVR